MKRGFTLIEVVISLAFITVIGLITAVILRTVAFETAADAAANRLERSLIRTKAALRDELRFASTDSIQLLDLSPTSVFRGIEFQIASALADDGSITISAVRRIEVSVNNEFVLIGDGPTRILGTDASPRDDTVDGPGLAFSQANPESLDFTIRVRGVDPQTGAIQTRSLTGRIPLRNP